MNGFRDSGGPVRKPIELKEPEKEIKRYYDEKDMKRLAKKPAEIRYIEKTVIRPPEADEYDEEPEKPEFEQEPKRRDSFLRLLQLQLTVCLIFFLCVMGIKSINSTFYTSVRAGTFEKSYTLTNLWDINSKLDSAASKSKLFAFILGRQTSESHETISNDYKDDAASTSSGITDKAASEEETVSAFSTTTNNETISTFGAARTAIATVDEATLETISEDDDTSSDTASNTSSESSSSATSSTSTNFPKYDTAVHAINTTYYNPVKSYITSDFGERSDPITKKQSFHTGIDLGVVTGTKVICPMNGTVTKTGYSSVWGNYILVNHGNSFETFYAHLSAVKVKKNATVKAQTVLGLSGTTGRSTGPHLHFEVRYNGVYQDPQLYFQFK